jgi:hypothetical protein
MARIFTRHFDQYVGDTAPIIVSYHIFCQPFTIAASCFVWPLKILEKLCKKWVYLKNLLNI